MTYMTTIPEPRRDICAQLGALIDPEHPKRVVFIDGGLPESVSIPPGIHTIRNRIGTLITNDSWASWIFSLGGLCDDDMSIILGYPEPKSKLIDPVVVQATNEEGDVIMEACASRSKVGITVDALSKYGITRIVSVSDVIERRLRYGNL